MTAAGTLHRRRLGWLPLIAGLVVPMASSAQDGDSAGVIDFPPTVVAGPAERLVAEDGLDGARFGTVLVLANGILAVSSPDATVGERPNVGSVHVLSTDADPAWSDRQTLAAADSREYLRFGIESMALSADVLAVAASQAEIAGEPQQGAVYLFAPDAGDGGWQPDTILVDESGRRFDWFGSALAVSADRLVVGARGAGNGRVVIYRRTAGDDAGWTETARLHDGDVGDGGDNEDFGNAVALDGDRLLVAASSADVSGLYENDGAVYVFEAGADDAWILAARLVANEAALCLDGLTIVEFNSQRPDDRQAARDCARSEHSRSDHDAFGHAIAISGDRVAVGAPYAEGDDGSYSAGAVYVFDRDTEGHWRESARLTPGPGNEFAYFGSALAMDGDILLVGAHGATIAGKSDQGAVWAYRRGDDGVWLEDGVLIAADGFGGDHFGAALATDGERIFIAASADDDGRGSLYIYPRTHPGSTGPGGPEPTVESPWPLNGELAPGGLVSHESGVRLHAPGAALEEPLAVWIHEIEPPAVPPYVGAVAAGPVYTVGAADTVLAAAGTAFGLALPLPAGADPGSLVAAALVDGEHVFDDWTGGAHWTPLAGVLDTDEGMIVVTLSALSADGIGIALLEDTELAGLTTQMPAAPTATNDDEPVFNVRCVGFSHDPSRCGEAEEQAVEAELLDALATFRAAGLKDPALRRLVLGMYDAPIAYGPHPVWILSNYSGYCLSVFGAGGVGGVYMPMFQDMYLCMSDAGRISAFMKGVARHELFHAVHRAHSSAWWYPSGMRWISEGLASAVMGNSGPPKIERYTLSGWDYRRIDIPLDDGGGETLSSNQPPHPKPHVIPYQAQDFWVHYTRANGLGLSDLAVILDAGRSTADIATVMTSPTLGESWWRWVKNQAIEKTIDLPPGEYPNRCYAVPDVLGAVERRDYPGDDPVIGGQVAGFAAAVIQISITEETTRLTVGADEGGSGNALRYKVYIDGESGCHEVADGERTFDHLASGKHILVILGNTSPGASSSIAYEVRLTVPEGE